MLGGSSGVTGDDSGQRSWPTGAGCTEQPWSGFIREDQYIEGTILEEQYIEKSENVLHCTTIESQTPGLTSEGSE